MIIDKLNAADLHSRIVDHRQAEMIDQGKSLISRTEIEKRYNQKAATLWITGLHGSGKNLLAYSLERTLFERGSTVVLLDGSTVRSGLTTELDFSPAGRAEQVRRVAHVCRILNDQGIMVICSFISPRESIRQQLAQLIGPERFHLIYMDADLAYCCQNKPELYQKAEEGKLQFLPGVDEAYEIPDNPSLSLKPENLQENIESVMHYLQQNRIFPLE